MKILLLSTVLMSQTTPCVGTPNPCETALYRKVVQQQIHTVTQENRLVVCEKRLQAVKVPEKELKLWVLLGTGLGGVVAGFAMGLLTAKIIK